jgi:sugar/nucleoside kinase (ribokinase family)
MKNFNIIGLILCFILISLSLQHSVAGEQWKTKTKDVFVLGQSIMDFTYKVRTRAEVTELIDKLHLKEGNSQLVEEKTISYLLDNMQYITKSAGGSASNTAAGLSQMGSVVSFKSVVGDDALGHFYREEMIRYNVDSILNTSDLEKTGVVSVIITSQNDSANSLINRTMAVYPGISTFPEYYSTTPEEIKDYKLVLTEGYLWEKSSNEIKSLFHNAKANQSLTAFTFGDIYIIKKYRDELLPFIKGVDIILADEQQILSLYQSDDLDNVIKELQKNNNITVITMGPQGAYIITSDNKHYIPAPKVEKIIDVTGAGDQFAAGFLYGYINNKSMEESGKLGAIKAAEIIQKIGGKPQI